ncbi:MAG: VPLPA-CTERM sorting domain-containing protein [Paracoccaceae bacterium]
MNKLVSCAVVVAALSSAAGAASITRADFEVSAGGTIVGGVEQITVGAGPELVIPGVLNSSFSFDLTPTGLLTLTIDLGGNDIVGAQTNWTVENVVFDTPATITGFSFVSGDQANVAGSSFSDTGFVVNVEDFATNGVPLRTFTFQATITDAEPTTAIPLPASLPLLLAGLGGLAVMRRLAR